MATFEGSVREFHSYVGPRIRNAINAFARKERKARKGVCEDCHEGGQTLESAHIRGKGRRTIIEAVLEAYTVDGRVRCDLATVEREILDGHGPISGAFRFLCGPCHKRYDAPASTLSGQPSGDRQANALYGNGSVELLFDPYPEDVFKAELIQAKRAFVRLYKANGEVEEKVWNAGNFTADAKLRNNLGSGFLRKATERGIIKAAFSITKPAPVDS